MTYENQGLSTNLLCEFGPYCFGDVAPSLRGDLCPSFEHKDDTKSLPLPGDTFALRGNTDCDISSFIVNILSRQEA